MKPDLCEKCGRGSARYYCRGCRKYICYDCKAEQVGMSCSQAVCYSCQVARQLKEPSLPARVAPAVLDYVIVDDTGIPSWPGRLPFRGRTTRRGKGYRTREEALARMRAVNEHWRLIHGCSAGELRVVERMRRAR